MPAKTSKTADTAKINGVFDGATIDAVKQGAARSAELNKDNLDALTRSLTATAKGVEALGSESRAFAKQTMEEGIEASKAMMSAKTIQEFMTLQTDYSRSVFDQFVNQATKVNDIAKCMAEDAYAPLNERATALAEVMQKSGTA